MIAPTDLQTVWPTQSRVAQTLGMGVSAVNEWYMAGEIPLPRQYELWFKARAVGHRLPLPGTETVDPVVTELTHVAVAVRRQLDKNGRLLLDRLVNQITRRV